MGGGGVQNKNDFLSTFFRNLPKTTKHFRLWRKEQLSSLHVGKIQFLQFQTDTIHSTFRKKTKILCSHHVTHGAWPFSPNIVEVVPP